MSEALAIIQASSNRSVGKAYFRSHEDRFKLIIANQEKPPMVMDAYGVQDLTSPIIGYSLFYYGGDGPISLFYATVNPLVEDAVSNASDLIRHSLDSTSTPDGSTLHFLGIYDLDSTRILKIMVRKGQTSMGPEYSIGYIIQEKSAMGGSSATGKKTASFWGFFVGLFIASLIFPFVYGLLVMPFLGMIAMLFRSKEGNVSAKSSVASVLSYPVMGLFVFVNIYVLSGWSAYVASRAFLYSSLPEVTHSWIYYVVGFSLCHGPLSWMASKEEPDGSTGRMIHIGIAMVIYILFSIWPNLMVWPYGWFLRWVL